MAERKRKIKKNIEPEVNEQLINNDTGDILSDGDIAFKFKIRLTYVETKQKFTFENLEEASTCTGINPNIIKRCLDEKTTYRGMKFTRVTK